MIALFRIIEVYNGHELVNIQRIYIRKVFVWADICIYICINVSQA